MVQLTTGSRILFISYILLFENIALFLVCQTIIVVVFIYSKHQYIIFSN